MLSGGPGVRFWWVKWSGKNGCSGLSRRIGLVAGTGDRLHTKGDPCYVASQHPAVLASKLPDPNGACLFRATQQQLYVGNRLFSVQAGLGWPGNSWTVDWEI